MVFDQLALGVYYPTDSFLHRRRARTKLLLLLWLIGFATAANQRAWRVAPYAVLIGLACVGALLSGISLGHLWKRVRLLALVTAIGAILTILLIEDTGTPLYTIGPAQVPYTALFVAALAICAALAALLGLVLLGVPAARSFWQRRLLLRTRVGPLFILLAAASLLWLVAALPPAATFALGPLTITEEGTWLGFQLMAIFLSLYTLALLLTITTTPVALIEGLTALLGPLRRLRLPVDEFALMTLLALRFIPTLTEEVELLIKAHTARGADFTHGSLRERAQSLATLFVPLLHGALRRAAELATALDARGYTVEGTQTLMQEGPLAIADYLALGLVMLVSIWALLV
jgi:energy-coupling factor transport system permease protein